MVLLLVVSIVTGVLFYKKWKTRAQLNYAQINATALQDELVLHEIDQVHQI